MEDYKMGKVKKIALIAHDNRKEELIKWVETNKNILEKHILCGTGTTARLITETSGLSVKAYKSGPLGGDQQIGALIAENGVGFIYSFGIP